jgi:hypothetical protein
MGSACHTGQGALFAGYVPASALNLSASSVFALVDNSIQAARKINLSKTVGDGVERMTKKPPYRRTIR